MRPPSLPKIRPSTLPSRDLLSSLVLPPPTSLKEYLLPPAPRSLRGCAGSGRGIGSDRPLAALRGNNLLWFSTRGSFVCKSYLAIINSKYDFCMRKPKMMFWVTCQNVLNSVLIPFLVQMGMFCSLLSFSQCVTSLLPTSPVRPLPP